MIVSDEVIDGPNSIVINEAEKPLVLSPKRFLKNDLGRIKIKISFRVPSFRFKFLEFENWNLEFEKL